MVLNPDVLFLHIPKTGGTSCTDFLCQALAEPVFLSSLNEQLASSHFRATLIPGMSHETLSELQGSSTQIKQRTGIALTDVKLIIAVVRHPYEIELSNFHFYRSGNRNILRNKLFRDERTVWRIDLAQGDFSDFVAQSGHFRTRVDGSDIRCEDYLLVNGEMDHRIKVLRSESLSTEFPRLVAPFTDRVVEFPFANRSQRSAAAPFEDLGADLQQLIYLKHRWVFDQGYYEMPS